MKGMTKEARKRYPPDLVWTRLSANYDDWVDRNQRARQAFIAGIKWAEAQQAEKEVDL